MKERIAKVCGIYLLLAAAVLGYFLFFKLTGHGLDCPFHVITGLYCPGCGNSRGLHALLTLHPMEALRFNYMMPLQAVFVLYLCIVNTKEYLQTGVYRLMIGSEKVGFAFLALLLIWWVVRNVLGI